MTRRINSKEERESVYKIMANLLSDRLNRKKSKNYSHSNDRHYKGLCSLLLWYHSEADGKYNGCRYWSTGAIESRKKHRDIVTSRAKYGGDALLHEHLYPRKQLIEDLFSMTTISVNEIKKILNRLNIGVVITFQEDILLLKDGVKEDPWLRYRNAGLKIKELNKNFKKVELITNLKIGREDKESQPVTLINPMSNAKQNTNIFARDAVLGELKKKGFNVQRSARDFLIGGKRINVRGCNYDNGWARKANLVGGFDRIDPKKFDYLICVSFDNNFNNIRYFIFSSHEAEQFPDIAWKTDRLSELKNLTLKRDDLESDCVMKSSENKWDKLK